MAKGSARWTAYPLPRIHAAEAVAGTSSELPRSLFGACVWH